MFALVVFMTLFLFSMSYAQQTLKIAIVNSQKVLEQSAEGKRIMSQLEQRQSQYQDELARLDEEINQLQTRLNTQRLTLTQEAYSNLASEIDRKQTDRKRKAEDSYRAMQELSNRLFTRLQNEVMPIINQIGKEKNLDLVFDLMKSGAIYFSPTIDITDEVIQKYDVSKANR
jgi:Skp family chaperone for outer membrane proteins